MCVQKINADVNKNVLCSLREENFVSKQRLFFTFARKKKYTTSLSVFLFVINSVHDRERIARLFCHHHRRKEEEHTFGKRRIWIFFVSSSFSE